MRPEKKNNRKKLAVCFVAAIAVMLIAVAVSLALFLPGNQGGNVPGDAIKLYWNIDGKMFTENSETGLSDRQKGDDGLYHVRFAIDGQQVELTVADDRQLINYIDSMQILGLVQDADGVVIDAIDPKTVATEVAKDFFVKRVEAGKVCLNSSRAMNGMDIEVEIAEITGIYDVDPGAEMIGMTGQMEELDQVTVYAREDGATSHIFIIQHPIDAEVYWRVERCWDSEKSATTRIPDENGVYTMEFAHDGQIVLLKCKDKNIVAKIDNTAVLFGQFSFLFDEEGYITEMVDVGLAVRGSQLASDYHITAINGDTYTATRLSTGSDQGRVITFKMAPEYDVFQCCQYGCYENNCGERVDGLKLNDRVNLYANMDGEVILAFVSRRTVDSPMYFNFNRQYSGNAEKGTNRTKVNGYYVFELLCDGKVVTVRTQDKAIADKMDAIYNRCMGLKLSGDIVERVYDGTCIYGGAPLSSEGTVSSVMGPVISVVGTTSEANGLMTADCQVYNAITGEYGKQVGGTTTLQVGDQVTCYRNGANEVAIVFVLARQVDGAKVYYNLNRSYDSEKQETKRVPDENGYYSFEMACEGKTVTVKTKSKGMASFIDQQQAPLVGLKVNKDGIVTNAYVVASALKNAAKACNYRYVENVTKTSFNTFYYPAATPDVKKQDDTSWKIAADCVVYNVSTVYTSNRGEKTTLKNGDYIQAIKDLKTGEIIQIFVMQRDPTYGVASYDANCAHCGKVVTWKPYNGRIANADAHYFACMDITTSQGIIGNKDDGKVYDVVLDLKGHTLTGSGRVFLVYDKLTIIDSKGGGKVVGTSMDLGTGTGLAGSCVMVGDGGVLNLMGGELTLSDKSDAFGTQGGVLYVGAKGATVNMTGGKIVGGSSTERGGNIIILGGNFNMSGGIVEGGTAPSGSNIYASSKSQITVTGGKIDGGVYILNNCVVTLSGAPEVTGTGLEIVPGTKLAVSELTSGASIVVKANGIFTEELSDAESYLQYFHTAAEGDSIAVVGKALSYNKQAVDYSDVDNSELSFAAGTTNAHCPVCDSVVSWTALTAESAIDLKAGKHYYVPQDIIFTGDKTFMNAPGAGSVCVHLNGHNITAVNQRVFQGSGSTLNIMGSGVVTGGYQNPGAYILSGTVGINTNAASGAINLIGGTYISSTTAPVVAISANGGSINLFEGATIKGDADTRSVYIGGAELINASFLMYGGRIEGGTVFMTGANTTKGNEAAFAMFGGTITGGIQLSKNAQMGITGNPVISDNPLKIPAGVKIFIGDLTEGANILVSANGVFTAECSDAEAIRNYFKPVSDEHTINVSENALKYVIPGKDTSFALDSDGDGKAVCPACGGAEVQWTAISGAGSISVISGTHYYLAEDIESAAGNYMTLSAKSACLHLNGHNITYAGRIFLTTANANLLSKLNIMGDGVVTSTGTHDTYATGTIHLAGTVELNLYGGTYRYQGTTYAPIRVAAANSVANVYEGAVIDGGNGTAAMVEKGNFNLLGGTVIGTVDATGGTVTLDGAADAERIAVAANAKLIVNAGFTGAAKAAFASPLVDGAIPAANGASTGAFAGQLMLDAEGNPVLMGKDGKLVINDNTSDDTGDASNELVLDANGMGYCDACEQTVSWTAISGTGSVAVTSGTHYYLANDIVSTAGAYMTLSAKTACLHLNGHDLTYSGRIFLTTANANLLSKLNIMGDGVVTSTGTHDTYATGTIHLAGTVELNLYGGTYRYQGTTYAPIRVAAANSVANVYEGAVIDGGNGTAAMVEKGNFNLLGGTVIGTVDATGGTVTLDGAADAERIAVAANAKLIVNAGFTGAAKAAFASPLVDGAIPAANGASTGAFAGQLMLDAEGNPVLMGKDGKLVINDNTSDDTGDASNELVLDANGMGYCDACEQTVSWTAISGTGSVAVTSGTHYYLANDIVSTAGAYMTLSAKTACLHLNGHDLTYSGRIFLTTANVNLFSKLNIMGDGVVTSTGTHDTYATGTIHLAGTVELNLYGGTYRYQGTTYAPIRVAAANSVANVYEGAIIDGGNGTAIVVDNGTLNLLGGTVIGSVNASKGTVNLDGGTVADRINIAENAKLVVKSGFSGTASASFAALTNNSIPVTNGVSEGAYTGMLYLNEEGLDRIVDQDGTLVVVKQFDNSDLVFDTGTANAVCPACGEMKSWTAINGTGSVSVTSGNHYYLASDIVSTAGAYMTLSAKTACLHLNGHDLTYSGRIFLTTANVNLFSKLNIMGDGVVTSTGTHDTYATGTIHLAGTVELNLYGGTYRYQGTTYAPIRVTAANGVANIYDGAVIDGDNGTAIMVENGTLNLLGGTIVGSVNATKGTVNLDAGTVADRISIAANAKLVVKTGFTGTVTVDFPDMTGNDILEVNGISEGAYTGKIYLRKDELMIVVGEDGKLVIRESEDE